MKTKLYTDEEIKYIVDNYPTMDTENIAKHLDRTVYSIKDKANRLKLSKKIFDFKYFDNIDNPDKAYWLGFIWCDGYLGIRKRENRNVEYNLKISLKKDDFKHLEKFNKCIDGNYTVKYYTFDGSFASNYTEARLFITNQYLGKVLSEKYGIFPRRKDPMLIINNLSEIYYKDFIRGVLDADGSFTYYQCKDRGYLMNKYAVTFGGQEVLLKWIEDILIKNKLIPEHSRKLYKRHKEENRDGYFLSLNLSGRLCFNNVLQWLYDDSNIYLDRKFEKYTNIIKNQKGGDVNAV